MSIEDAARRRTAAGDGRKSQRKLSENYEMIGLRGEQALAEFLGVPMDLRDKPYGDGGLDYPVETGGRVVRLDVKAFRQPKHLLVERGKVKADIYVLAGYIEQADHASLLKWATAAEVLAAPVSDRFAGVPDHYIKREKLRDLEELEVLLGLA